MNPSQYQHLLKHQQKRLKKLLIEINKRGSKYAVFSNLFSKVYERAELIKIYFESIENQFKIVNIWFANHPNAMVTINTNNEVLLDENKNFIIDHQKGIVISLKDYYLRVKNEYEKVKEALDCIEKEFEKVKNICPDDCEKYNLIKQYEENQMLLEIINNKKER